MKNKTGRWTFNSQDGDIWGHEDFETKEEAIRAGKEHYEGDYNCIEIGRIRAFTSRIDAENVVEFIADNAYDECGEVAEGYLYNIPREQEERLEELLNEALNKWLKETENYPTFWSIEDVVVCNLVLEYAIDCINSAVKRLRYRYLKNGYSTKGLENDYALGFITGLETAFEKQKDENQEWALVLIKDEAVINAYNQINFEGSINTGIEFQMFRDAYLQGVKDGEKFDITDKITEGKGEEKILNLNMP